MRGGGRDKCRLGAALAGQLAHWCLLGAEYPVPIFTLWTTVNVLA